MSTTVSRLQRVNKLQWVHYLADTESHAESHNNDVTSVPWLCFDITLLQKDQLIEIDNND